MIFDLLNNRLLLLGDSGKKRIFFYLSNSLLTLLARQTVREITSNREGQKVHLT